MADNVKVVTLRDILARRMFGARPHDFRMTERAIDNMWASPDFASEKERAFRLADALLDTVQRWIDRTSDGKLSTARELRWPSGNRPRVLVNGKWRDGAEYEAEVKDRPPYDPTHPQIEAIDFGGKMPDDWLQALGIEKPKTAP